MTTCPQCQMPLDLTGMPAGQRMMCPACHTELDIPGFTPALRVVTSTTNSDPGIRRLAEKVGTLTALAWAGVAILCVMTGLLAAWEVRYHITIHNLEEIQRRIEKSFGE